MDSEKKKAMSDGVDAAVAQAAEGPDPADCMRGTYQFVVAYTCTCGKQVGVGGQSAIQAALNNGAIRIKHECGQWWFLTPATKFNVQMQGRNGNGNRQQRRAASAQLRRSPGGILVPR